MHRPILVLALLLPGFGAQAAMDRPVPAWEPAGAAAKTLAAAPAALVALPPGSVTAMARRAAKDGEPWRIALPDGRRLAVDAVSATRHPNGDVTHAGSLAGSGEPVLFTVGREASFGSFRTGARRWYFEARGGDAWLVDLAHPGLEVLDPDQAAVGVSGAAPAAPQARAKDGHTVIDVLFVHDAGFALRYPGSGAQTRVNHLVAIANQVFANSGVALVLRLVGVDPVAYPTVADPGFGQLENGFALEALSAAVQAPGATAGFGELAARRAEAGADLVTLIWPHDIEERGSCGIAFLQGGPEFGVNVVSDGFDSWSLCSEETYAHEVGHNLGAEHQDGANSEEAGFGTAYIRPGRLHTVMGSFGSGHPDRYLGLMRMSNPQQLCGGAPCGVAGESDNARRARDTMAGVAAYLPTTSTAAAEPPPAIDPDTDGDGVPESADAFPSDARYSADRDGDGVADAIDAFPDDPAEQRDSDDDGIGDSADGDDDGDGAVDAVDAFPLDASEQSDADGDGVGDQADAFPADRREWSDIDGDGIGDNAEDDRDGDGVPEFAAAMDLLVTSLGSDRVLRLHGDSGLFERVEVAASHQPQALGQQSRLAWDPAQKLVHALVAGQLRRYEPASGTPLGPFIAANSLGPLPALASSFSAGLAVSADGTVFVADDGARLLARHDAIDGSRSFGGDLWQPQWFDSAVRDAAIAPDGSVWVLERDGRLSRYDAASGQLLATATPPVDGFRTPADATGLAFTPDGSAILVAERGLDRVMRVPTADLSSATVLVAGGSGGLDRPGDVLVGPDGLVYASSEGSHRILRYDLASGDFVDAFDRVPPGALSSPRAMAFVPRVADRHPTDPAQWLRPVAGGWYNPARSGHGLDLQLIGSQLSIIWYTFEADGSPTWYLAAGPLQGAVWSAPLLKFRWDGAEATSEAVGSAALAFASETEADFSWELPGSTGSEPMQVLRVASSRRSQFPTAAWFDPAQPGWGLSVTRNGEVTYAIAFLYDEAGEPSWVGGNAPSSDGELVFPMAVFDGPTRCPGCPGAADATAEPAGEMRFRATGLSGASFDSAIVAPGPAWSRQGTTMARLTDTPTRVNGDPLAAED